MIAVRSLEHPNEGLVHIASVCFNGNYFIWCTRAEDTNLAWGQCDAVPTCLRCMVNV